MADGAKLRLVFCGTPQFAVPSLQALIAAGHEIALVVSQPDRPVGRKQVLTAPPVKELAITHGLKVTQPEKIKNNLEFRARLESIVPDAIVVVAYGRIIPRWMLDLPRLGCINLHGSLLPKYRGAAPIQWAVAMGETVTGNTTMLLEEGLDTGPILLQQTIPISPEETAVELFARLALAGAPLLVETLAGLAEGSLQPQAQDHSLATLESLARLSALARSVHLALRQKTDRPAIAARSASGNIDFRPGLGREWPAFRWMRSGLLAGVVGGSTRRAQSYVRGGLPSRQSTRYRDCSRQSIAMKSRKPVRKAPTAVSPARFEAFAILMEVGRNSAAHSDDQLRSNRICALSAQDRNLCTTLVLGVLRWQILLDRQIRAYLSRPDARLDPAIQTALRLGLFQLHYLDRIPAHAAISESVNLAKLAGHQFAARMVNAVLRMLAGSPKHVAADGSFASVRELAETLAHPHWIVERWAAAYGLEATRAICDNGQRQPELAIRLEGSSAEAELVERGIQLAPGALLSAARRVISGDVTATEALLAGRVRIQEEGSQLIAEMAGKGQRILDACAAPGGKTLILAERNPQARITALEVSPARCEALRERVAASAYAEIEVRLGSAAELASESGYDLVLADAPCSGTGTLGRNPEIRHRLKLEDLARHHERQCAILRGALRVGTKRVIYSTCSLEPEENGAVVAEVLARAPDWRQVSVTAALAELGKSGRLAPDAQERLTHSVDLDGSLILLPGVFGADVQTDGFFAAILEKSSSVESTWRR